MKREDLKVGAKFKQIKPIEDYGFDYVGEEFTVTSNNGIVVIGKCYSKGVGCGIEIDKFEEYFELVKEPEKAKDTYEFKMGDIVRIKNEVFKNVEGQILSISKENIDNNTISLIAKNNKLKNIITVYITDLELVEAFKRHVNKEKFERIIDDYTCTVKIRGLRTTVSFIDNEKIYKGSVYCNVNDLYKKEDGITRAYNKALVKCLQDKIHS